MVESAHTAWNVRTRQPAGGARGARAKGEHPSTPRDSQVSAERTDKPARKAIHGAGKEQEPMPTMHEIDYEVLGDDIDRKSVV